MNTEAVLRKVVFLFGVTALLTACGGGGGGADGADTAGTGEIPAGSYAVTGSANAGGSITPSQVVVAGATATLTVMPNSGYLIVGVSGCGGTLSGNTYTTAPVSANCTVNAVFASSTHTVSVASGAGGAVAPNAPQSITHGETTSFTVTPDVGYSVSAIYGCNGVLSGNTYTTAPIVKDCTVTANFVQGTTTLYNITVVADPALGAADGGGAYSSGTKVTLTATPNPGYLYGGAAFFDPAIGNYVNTPSDVSVALNGSTTEVTFTPSTNYTVYMNFRPESVFVTASAGTGGTVTPPSQMLKPYYKAYVTLTPNSGYAVDVTATLEASTCVGVLVDGFTFKTTNLGGDCRIAARFKTQVDVTASGTWSGRGIISPDFQTVQIGNTAAAQITPFTGWYPRAVSGCNNGRLDPNLNIYTTGAVTEDCQIVLYWDNVQPTAYYNVTVSASPTTGGRADGGGTYVTYSPNFNYAVLSAEPYFGYAFAGWTKDGVLLSSDAVFNLQNSAGDKNIVANFVPISTLPKYTVSFVTGNVVIRDEETYEFVTSLSVYQGQSVQFGAFAMDRSATLLSLSGCGVTPYMGYPYVSTYTGPITSDCTVTATAY